MVNKPFSNLAIIGLLLAQIIGALLMGLITGGTLIALFAASVFLLVLLYFIVVQSRKAVFIAALSFAFGLLHIAYLSLGTASLWQVLLLSLDAAGFVLTLDRLGPFPMPIEPKPLKRYVLERNLPSDKEKGRESRPAFTEPSKPAMSGPCIPCEKPRVTVYHDEAAERSRAEERQLASVNEAVRAAKALEAAEREAKEALAAIPPSAFRQKPSSRKPRAKALARVPAKKPTKGRR
jgi:hypothetical protein